MAPRSKRKPPPSAAPTNTASSPNSTSTPRHRLHLAKQNSLTAVQESEIHESFLLFAVPSSQSKDDNDDNDTNNLILPTPALRKTLIALNTPPASASELREIVSTLDPDGTGEVEYEYFVAVAALKLRSAAEGGGGGGGAATSSSRGKGKGRKGATAEPDDEEIDRAFALFTASSGRQEITLADLRRVAGLLREEVDEAVLRDMVREANGGGSGREGVGREAFVGVMERAGVF